MTAKDGGPAFPVYCGADDGPSFKEDDCHFGLRLRDYFAIRFAAAIWVADERLRAGRSTTGSFTERLDITAANSYAFADAMLEARKK